MFNTVGSNDVVLSIPLKPMEAADPEIGNHKRSKRFFIIINFDSKICSMFSL